jgi:hypothetical protein
VLHWAWRFAHRQNRPTVLNAVRSKIVMPELSRFLGIVIYMYFNEHNPPHFHAEYNEYNAAISINTLGVIEGKLPSKVLSLVVEWGARLKQNFLKIGITLKTRETTTKLNR